MRIALVTASLVLVGGLAGACGGDSPDDASTEDFCDAWTHATESEDDFDKGQEAYEELADVGTPEDMGDDAREGFEFITDLVADASDEDEIEEAINDLSSDEEEKLQALIDYVGEECGEEPSTTEAPSAVDPPSDLPSIDPSEIPTDLPSDFPTELPSDFPSELLSELPSEFPSELLSELPSDFPSELLSEMPSAPSS